MDFTERFLLLLNRVKMTQKDLAEAIGCGQSTISGWKNGRSIPPADIAVKIARQFQTSVEYLIEGDGEGKDGELMVVGAQVRGKNIIPFSSANDDNIVYVEYYDVKASAGSGVQAPDYTESSIVPVLRSFVGPYNPATVKSVVVAGDSMTKIHLFEGDVVFFVPSDTRADGLYVIGIDERLFVKRLEYDILGLEIKVKSENDRYSTQVLKGEDMNRLRVVGKVIGWITRHPY